jgi:hypothetical protein
MHLGHNEVNVDVQGVEVIGDGGNCLLNVKKGI